MVSLEVFAQFMYIININVWMQGRNDHEWGGAQHRTHDTLSVKHPFLDVREITGRNFIESLLVQSGQNPREDATLVLPVAQQQPALPSVEQFAPGRNRLVQVNFRIPRQHRLGLPLRRERIFLE